MSTGHGGARPGSGRPRLPSEQKRQQVILVLDPQIATRFKTRVPAGLRSAFVERLLRRALARQWQQ